MFEKDAEEKGVKYADNLKPSIGKFDGEEGYSWSQVEEGYENGFKDGAEFGYNKANEWHYVKDEGIPIKEGHYLVCLRNKNKDIFDCWIYYYYITIKMLGGIL